MEALHGLSTVYLGPFLSPETRSYSLPDGIEYSGFKLEFATEHDARSVPIYRKVVGWRPNHIELTDYLIHENDLPLDITYISFFAVRSSKGLFVPLENLLVRLYSAGEVLRALPSFLEELRHCLPITYEITRRFKTGSDYIRAEAAAAGFEVTNIFSYGRKLSIGLGWVFPQDRGDQDSAFCLFAGYLDFRPTPERRLDPGKWREPRDTGLGYLLMKILRSIHSGSGADILSDTGKRVALERFIWTPLALMTTREAHQARIKFIRNHPELHHSPKELARALRKARLYSEFTSLNQITKSLPRIIAAATGQRIGPQVA